MAILQNLYNGLKTMLTTPLTDLTAPQLLQPMISPTALELQHQRIVGQARMYHKGEKATSLTERLRRFLGDEIFSLNYSKMVDNAVTERLIYKEMQALIPQTTAHDDVESQNQQNWFSEFWRSNRLGAHQSDIHEKAVTDGEYFAIVDFDGDTNRSRITLHKRYTSKLVNGDDCGVMMIYPDNDSSMQPLYALRRWHELDANNHPTEYIAVYLPDRVLLFTKNLAGWSLADTTSLINPRTGQPLGIPVIHFKMPNLQPEALSAWPMQRLLNKLVADLIIESDQNAFRIFAFFGWLPEDENGNPLVIEPGAWIGSEKKSPGDASLTAVPAADLASQDATIESFTVKMAILTDTPASRFQTTGQIAAEGTLKQMEAPLIKKLERRGAILAVAWEDLATLARRWHNAFANFGLSDFSLLDETVRFDWIWEAFYTETQADAVAELSLETSKLTNIVTKFDMLKIISGKQAAIEAGYTEEQFVQFVLDRKAEGDDAAATAALTLGKVFNTGAIV